MFQLASQRHTDQTGFTIIETLLFLAISALLMLVIIVGRGITVRRAQFTDTIESLQSRLIQLQREQFSTVSTGTGKDEDNILFMTVVTFAPGSPNVTVRHCTTDRDSGPAGIGAYDDFVCAAATESSFIMKWDATYDCQRGNPGSECANTILFLRHHDTGDLKTIGLNTEVGQTISGALSAGYDSTTATMREIGIRSSEGTLSGGVIINDSGNIADLGTNLGRINQIGKVFR